MVEILKFIRMLISIHIQAGNVYPAFQFFGLPMNENKKCNYTQLPQALALNPAEPDELIQNNTPILFFYIRAIILFC